MINNQLPEDVSQTLEKISPDIIRREQYMDFLRNRFFRQTLLCHNHHSLKRDIASEVINELLIASPLKPEQDPVDFSPNVNQKFLSPSGYTINTEFPLTKAALMVLSEYWPSAIHLHTLFKEVHARINSNLTLEEITQNQSVLLDDLLHCFVNNVIELRTWQAKLTTKISNKPKASKLAAYHATKTNQVTNQRHELVELDTLGREIVSVLDGTRDCKDLAECLRRLVEGGAVALPLDGSSMAGMDLTDDTLIDVVNQTLNKLANAALLID
jgi:methyltransferase-like protein